MNEKELQIAQDALLGSRYVTPLGKRWTVVDVCWMGSRCRVWLEDGLGGYWDTTLADWSEKGIAAHDEALRSAVAEGHGDDSALRAAASLDDMIGEAV